MARILAYTTPGRGHLFPLTPILDELGRRGHQIALRTLASQVPSMRARGFDAAPISDRIEAIAHDDWRATNPRAALARAVRVFAQRAEHDAADLDRAIDQARPDALLVDVNAWGAAAAAEAWAGPWAMLCPYPLPLRSRDVHRSGPGYGRPVALWGGYETSCCARSCSAPWSARWSRHSTASATSWGWRRSVAPTTSSAARRCCST